MEIRDTSSQRQRELPGGKSAQVTALYPAGQSNGLVAVDLVEIARGGATGLHSHGEEHIIYVISGSAEVSAGDNGAKANAPAGSTIYIAPNERHTIHNSAGESLRLLVTTPLLVKSQREMYGSGSPLANGVDNGVDDALPAESARQEVVRPEQSTRAPQRPEQRAPAIATPVGTEPSPADDAAEESVPDISGLMKRGSDMVGTPKAERKRLSVREPEPEPEQEAGPASDEDEEEEAPSNLMELFIVFEGSTRDKPPGQGYGSFLVQSPGRKPVVKRVEFGDNYTPAQAEYDALVACVKYVIERLEATGRTPAQVQLDIRSANTTVVNQLLGDEKVKDVPLRKRHEQSLELLGLFADWRIEWHEKDDSVRLLGS